MKKAILGLTALCVAASAPTFAQARARRGGKPADLAKAINYSAPKANGALSCSCNELERRIFGLKAMVKVGETSSFAADFPDQAKSYDADAVGSAVDSAETALDRAKGQDYNEQEATCGQAISGTNAQWSKVQGFLAQNGLDKDYYKNVKAQNVAVPNEGDLSGEGGRTCAEGSWSTESRALFAINGREGICKQSGYKVSQILRGDKDTPGFRCYEYK